MLLTKRWRRELTKRWRNTDHNQEHKDNINNLEKNISNYKNDGGQNYDI